MGLVSTQDDGLKVLEDAVAQHNVTAFGRAEEAMDWTGHPPEDFIHAINLALKIGAFMVARRISEKGAKLYPHDETVQLHARVLAPPKILRSDLPPDPGARANMDWLKKHSLEYRGRWIVLKDGNLLDSDDSFEKLIARRPVTVGILLTRIP